MPTKNAAPVAPEKTEVKTGELVARDANLSLDVIPDFMRADVGQSTGLEDMEQGDYKMPRLAIAQGLSPQLIETKPEFIPELRMMQLFNTLTGEIYGKGPLEFSVVARLPSRWIEFDADRNMVDPNVPVGDPRTLWKNDEDGKRIAPPATQFMDFIIVLLDTMEPVALSCARTAITAAKALNGLMRFRMPPVPMCAGRYTVETKSETNDKGTYGVYVFKNAGVVRDPDKYQMLKSMQESFQKKTIIIDRETHDTTGTTGETIPGETVQAGAGSGEPSGGDIPF